MRAWTWVHGHASALLLAVVSTAAIGAAPPPERPPLLFFVPAVEFENAQFVPNRQRLPPADEAPWQRVTLPHQWRHTHPGVSGVGWYRMKFHLEEVPLGVHGVFIPHRRAVRLTFFVNGALFGASTSALAQSELSTPLQLTIPADLLKRGDNVLHVRLEGSSKQIHGLPRVTFAGATEIVARMKKYEELGSSATRAFMIIALVVGFLSLIVWLAHRKDRVMLWYGIAGLSWGLARLAVTGLEWTGAEAVKSGLEFFVRYGLATTMVVLGLRIMALRWRRFEMLLWALLLAGFAAASQGYLATDAAHGMLWDLVYTAVPLAGLAIFAGRLRSQPRWSDVLQGISLLLIAALNFHEAARYFGWVDVDSLYLRLYHVPVMLFATGAAIFERHIAALKSLEAMNAELEDRVRQKAAEIEAYHARIAQAVREQALARERQRILEDMHDGLGASLIGLLHQVQSGAADTSSLERRVQDALQEMRLALDALQPRDGDLATVLGSLRYRLEKSIEATGVKLSWEVDELPRIGALEPWTVLSVQRIVLEAITNALRHSAAVHLRVAARSTDAGVEIAVEDDGRGFDAAVVAPGNGLRSMRARVARLGGRIQIVSAPRAGTAVRVMLPLRLPESDARDGTQARAPQLSHASALQY